MGNGHNYIWENEQTNKQVKKVVTLIRYSSTNTSMSRLIIHVVCVYGVACGIWVVWMGYFIPFGFILITGVFVRAWCILLQRVSDTGFKKLQCQSCKPLTRLLALSKVIKDDIARLQTLFCFWGIFVNVNNQAQVINQDLPDTGPMFCPESTSTGSCWPGNSSSVHSSSGSETPEKAICMINDSLPAGP